MALCVSIPSSGTSPPYQLNAKLKKPHSCCLEKWSFRSKKCHATGQMIDPTHSASGYSKASWNRTKRLSANRSPSGGKGTPKQ